MRYLRMALAAVAVLAATALSACTTGSTTATTTPPTTTAPSTTSSAPAAPSSGSSGSPADIAAITQNWEAFFNAKTPTAQRIALLQNGQSFASIIQAQAGSGLAATATAKVSSVTVTSPSQAAVTYSILIAGTPALANQQGTAVMDNGQWKVGDGSFCALLTLENAGSTSGLPAACPSGG
jgi:hypothetical protein